MSQSYSSEIIIFNKKEIKPISINNNSGEDLFDHPIWFYAPSVLIKDIKDDPSYIRNGRSYLYNK